MDAEWHDTKREKNTGEMSHPADGEAWQDFDRMCPTFADDPRNLRLAIATDGFIPFSNFSSTYSMWPILVTSLNLPPWECVNPSTYSMWPALVTPLNLPPGKDFDVFLEPLIEELKELWKGVDTFHVLHHDNKKGFTLHAVVLWCIHDFPALSTLSGRTTKGYYTCIYCDKNPLSRRLRHKLGYLEHRRYLPRNHPWRKRLDFDGEIEDQDALEKFTLEEVL